MSNFTESQKNTLVNEARTMLFYTETGADGNKLYSFSNAQVGTSRWSFGLLQFDVGGNPTAQGFLKGIGFTDAQVAELKNSATPPDLQSMNALLQSHKGEIDQYTDDTIAGYVATLDHIIDYVAKSNPGNASAIVNDSSLQLAIIDYHNQFTIDGLSSSTPPPNRMLSYLSGNPVSLAGGTLKASSTLQFDDIQNFINNTTYGINNTRAVNSRIDRYNTAMDKIGSGQLVGTNADPSLGTTFLDGVDALTGDLAESNLGDGLFSVIGTNGQVKSQITRSQAAAPYVESTTYTNGQASITVNGNGDIINISNANVKVESGSAVTVYGNGDAVNAGASSTVTLGGNNTGSSVSDNVYANGATINVVANSNVNVFGSSDTVTALGGNTNFGVYGGGDTINSQVGANVWTGYQGAGGAVNVVNANGAYVTVVESSNVSSTGASNVYIRQDASVSVSGDNEAIHVLGDRNTLQVYGAGDTTTVSGNSDTTFVRGVSDTTINNGYYDVTDNYGGGDRTFDYGSYDHNFNYGINEYGWSANATDTNYNAYSSDTGGGYGSYGYGGYGYGDGYGGGYYGYYPDDGTAGKSHGNGGSSGVDIGALVQFDKSHGDNSGAALAAKAWAQVQSAISNNSAVVTSGAKWDHEVVTWSFAQSGGNFSGSMGTSEEQAVQKAFDQWASATGLKFKEVSGSAKSDIRIGWGSFDTADTGVVGFTTVKTKKKAGAIVSAVVRLENPSENAFVSSASGGQVYAGTDASFDQVLLHEIGHVIGFRDNADPSSIENYALTDANRTLGSNDIAAAGALYGKPVLLAAVTPVSSGSAADIIQAMSSFAPAPMAVAARAANDATIVSDALAAGFHGERSPRYSAR